MSKTYTKDAVLENGYHQISIYDANSQSLLSTYQTTPDGKKDGKEIEYFKGSKGIKRKTNWKDGKKDGWEMVYDKDGDISSEKEYKEGECVKNRTHEYGDIYSVKRFLNKHTQIGHMTTHVNEFSVHGQDVRINNEYIGNTGWMGAHIVKENGELKHITIRGLHETIYDMEFKDNKEFNGYFKVEGTYDKHLSEYICTDGVLEGTVRTDKIDGRFVKGVFSGEELTNPKELASYDASRESMTMWQGYVGRKVRGYHVYEGGKHTEDYVEVSAVWNSYGYGREYEDFYCEPKKDGKLQGEYINVKKRIKTNYAEGKLEGLYTKFFDRIDGKKKVEGFYKEGKKEGVWKYYAEDGTVINQEYWHKGKNCTEKYEILKKVASKRIKEENKLSEGKDERVVLPKMTAKEKRDAIREAKKDLSR